MDNGEKEVTVTVSAMMGPFVPIEAVAKHFSVSISSVRSWVRRGYIPAHTYIKVGKTYRYSIPAVVESLKNHPETIMQDEGLLVPFEVDELYPDNPDEDL